MDKDDLIENIDRAVTGYLKALDSLGPRDWGNPEFTKKASSLPEYQYYEDVKSQVKGWIIRNKGYPVVLPEEERDLVKYFIDMCREELGEEIGDHHIDYFETALDESAEDLEGILERTKKLEIPFLNRPIPIHYKEFIQEANRCYVYGFHRACIAICRTLIETAIETKLKEKGRNIFEIKIKSEGGAFLILINEARRAGILDQETANDAHEIRKMANRYIHGKSPDERMNLEKDSYKAMAFVGKVLEHIL